MSTRLGAFARLAREHDNEGHGHVDCRAGLAVGCRLLVCRSRFVLPRVIIG
jgi:hypothetical protein